MPNVPTLAQSILVAALLAAAQPLSAQDIATTPWVTPTEPQHALGVSVETPTALVRVAEEQSARGRPLLRGALIGAGVGLVMGFLIRATADDANCLVPGECEAATGPSSTTAYLVLPLAGAAAGTLLTVATTRDRGVSVGLRLR